MLISSPKQEPSNVFLCQGYSYLSSTVASVHDNSELSASAYFFSAFHLSHTLEVEGRGQAQLCSMSVHAGPLSRQMPTLALAAPTPMSGAVQPPFSTWPPGRSPMQIFHRCRWCQQCTRGAHLMCRPACPPGCGKCCSCASALILRHGPLLQICTRLTNWLAHNSHWLTIQPPCFTQTWFIVQPCPGTQQCISTLYCSLLMKQSTTIRCLSNALFLE